MIVNTTLSGHAEMVRMLSTLPNTLRGEVRPRIRKITEVVASQARTNASFSSRIPGAIKTRVSFGARTAGGAVYVDANAAPHGRPINGRGSGSTFRHPVYGSDTWVSQPTIPFLDDAGDQKQDEAFRLMQDAIDATVRSAGG